MSEESIIAIVAAAVSALAALLALWQARSARAQAVWAGRQARAAEEANRLLLEQLTRQDLEAGSTARERERQAVMRLAQSANLVMHDEITWVQDWTADTLTDATLHVFRLRFDRYLGDLMEGRANATSDTSVSAVDVIEAAVDEVQRLRKSVTSSHRAMQTGSDVQDRARMVASQIRERLGHVEQMQWLTAQLAAPHRGILAEAIREHLRKNDPSSQ
ncbi:hypothetical protein [Catenuloplanes indicus]|uniref:Uncharacterized protein n=1 Tax=Catenuloplanes indicus TaxID=137267 RepID=A0AAE3W094_9ACTN|nr:hypothetical protein [Catenuloplanes indicus]MDQ0366867.1 hypothetical protein [Catenuloplanes indicus]